MMLEKSTNSVPGDSLGMGHDRLLNFQREILPLLKRSVRKMLVGNTDGLGYFWKHCC